MIHVRPIEIKDISEQSERFKELLLMCSLHNFPHSDYMNEYIISTFERLVQYHADGTAILFGAFEETTLAGFLWAYERMVLGEIRVHLRELVVDSAYRRNGIGKQLIEILIAAAKNRGIASIELLTSHSNSGAVSFYENLGFECERVQMVKKLGGSA